MIIAELFFNEEYYFLASHGFLATAPKWRLLPIGQLQIFLLKVFVVVVSDFSFGCLFVCLFVLDRAGKLFLHVCRLIHFLLKNISQPSNLQA